MQFVGAIEIEGSCVVGPGAVIIISVVSSMSSERLTSGGAPFAVTKISARLTARNLVFKKHVKRLLS